MSETLRVLLELAQGPLFRFAFALMILALLRLFMLAVSDVVGGWIVEARPVFWKKIRMRLVWLTFPSAILRHRSNRVSTPLFAYHIFMGCVSLVFRISALALPAFMAAHVYLWERAFGISWPALGARAADVLAIVTLISGGILFLSRFYSPLLRAIEPGWSFLKPLILLLPFGTGYLVMHPTWIPQLDYYVMLLLHIASACVVFVLVPFGRLLTAVHTPLVKAVPEAAWRKGSEDMRGAGAALAEGAR
jgi:hypothetical protein